MRSALALLATLAIAGGATASGADFTAASASTGNTFTAAADFNTVAVSLTDPGATLAGTVALSATASSNRGIASATVQRAPTGTSDWVDVCTDAGAPYGCSWNTTATADGSYDLRATATDTAGYSRTTAVIANRTVDNHTFSVALADPGAAVSGTISLTATAANATGGLQSMTIQHRAAGAATWTNLCTGNTSPRSCNLDTTALPEGGREMRAIGQDAGGHSAIGNVITRTIDNTAPTSTPSIPPSGSGTVTMSATAGDTGSGVAYVAFEVYYLGTWYEICRDPDAPYTCAGDSTQVPDGTYNVHTIVVDNAGVRTTSPSSSLTVDNTAPSGTSVTTNGTQGRLTSGDWIRLTWSEPIAPASVLAGWTGTSTAVTVRVNNVGSNDEMDFYDSANATRLNLVNTATDLKLGGNYVSTSAVYSATMVQSGASITITLGTVPGGLPTAANGTMTWRPSAAATDLVGNPGTTTQWTEPGIADRDF